VPDKNAYAQGTSVPVSRSKTEIEATLKRFGADEFAYGVRKDGSAQIGFVARGRRIRFTLSPIVAYEMELDRMEATGERF
jgi:hypothetical protein